MSGPDEGDGVSRRPTLVREGTLSQAIIEDTGQSWEELVEQLQASGGILGPADFCDKADALVQEMQSRGKLSASRARALARDVKAIRAALTTGANQHLIYTAIGAGLAYSNLRNEKRDDAGAADKRRRCLTRGRYFAARRALIAEGRRPTDEAVAERVGVTHVAVGKFRRKHLLGDV